MNLHRLLARDKFLACFAEPMQDVTATAEADIDIWAYVDAIRFPLEGFDGFRDVQQVYRDANGRFDQVLISTRRPSVFIVVVVDLMECRIYGHRLIDLTTNDET